MIRSYLKKRILVQGQGGRYIRTGGILQYFEDLDLAPNAEIGPKDFFETASITHIGLFCIVQQFIDNPYHLAYVASQIQVHARL